MNILIADDDRFFRHAIEAALTEWGHTVLSFTDGAEACAVLEQTDGPRLALLDWMMPHVDGPEVCRRIRQTEQGRLAYLILLTARTHKADVITGLDAGADDYITKPFERGELQARLHVGIRTLALQTTLADNVRKLQDALTSVQQLQGLLPICSYCKRIRDDQNYWHQVESYLGQHAPVRFSHGICPKCYEQVMEEEFGVVAGSGTDAAQ